MSARPQRLNCGCASRPTTTTIRKMTTSQSTLPKQPRQRSSRRWWSNTRTDAAASAGGLKAAGAPALPAFRRRFLLLVCWLLAACIASAQPDKPVLNEAGEPLKPNERYVPREQFDSAMEIRWGIKLKDIDDEF